MLTGILVALFVVSVLVIAMNIPAAPHTNYAVLMIQLSFFPLAISVGGLVGKFIA